MRTSNLRSSNVKKKSSKNSIQLILKKSILPISAFTLFATTVYYWNTKTYGLSLECNGQHIATVADGKVYEEATHLIRNQVLPSEKFKVHTVESKIKITPVSFDECCMQPETVKNKLVEQLNEILSSGYSIYVNDSLITITDNEENIKTALEEILESKKQNFPEAKAEFEDKIEVKKGIFSTENIQPKEKVKEILDSKKYNTTPYIVQDEDSIVEIAKKFDMDIPSLLAINNKNSEDSIFPGDTLNVLVSDNILHVKLTMLERLKEEIPYETICEEDSNLMKGHQEVAQEGSTGLEEVTYRLIYKEGKEINREEIERKILNEPIPEKLLIGTKAQEYLWPVPFTKKVTSPFGPRNKGYHYGMDIACKGVVGTDILAAKDGIVEKVSLGNKGYGNHIIINHEDGTQTLYAHCKKVNVKTNQKVTQGEQIGLVGSTGDSTGPHLHFEVRINGVRKNPADFVS